MKTRLIFIAAFLLLLPTILGAQQLSGPDTVRCVTGFNGRATIHLAVSNPGADVIQTGIPFIVPFASAFSMFSNAQNNFLPNEVRQIAILYNPTQAGCDTAYYYLPYSKDSQLVVVMIGCTSSAAVSESNEISLGVSIYPNPFNSQTIISITNASRQMKVSLTGQIGNTFSLPPDKRIVLDAKELGLADGTYILRIEDGDQVLIKNIILQK
ncbi:MAG TPA: T9SS type A sorting domain-containing protein [Candidatus Kapabacteria bacterium]|nr:T9SS type A sorting domain-containing protein [Candidatus Kapabacteria bacterium]